MYLYVGYRPLQHAVVSGAYEVVEALVARWRVPVDVPAADGATALHIAAYTGHQRIVRPLNSQTLKSQSLKLACCEPWLRYKYVR